MSAERRVDNFAVQVFNEAAACWRVINDRIKVAEYLSGSATYETALKQARAEAERQVSNWSAAYPLRRYRAVAVEL